MPEWYYLPFYAILRSIPSKLGGAAAMFAAVAIIAFLPWLDTSRVKSATYRPIFKIFFWIFVACAILLGYIGSQPPEGGYIIAGRFLTAYYFIHFLVILPLLSHFERTRPLPASIADAVLGAPTKTDAAQASP